MQAAKATLPWQPEQQTPVRHVTRFEKSRQECEYDLVLDKFRDAEREMQLKHKEKASLEHGLENARVGLASQDCAVLCPKSKLGQLTEVTDFEST